MLCENIEYGISFKIERKNCKRLEWYDVRIITTNNRLQFSGNPIMPVTDNRSETSGSPASYRGTASLLRRGRQPGSWGRLQPSGLSTAYTCPSFATFEGRSALIEAAASPDYSQLQQGERRRIFHFRLRGGGRLVQGGNSWNRLRGAR